MRRVIIESPYAGAVDDNVEYARRCVLDSLRRGEAPLASHLLYTQCLDDADPDERHAGIMAGLEWYAVADACVVYCDNGVSRGMRLGIQRALEHGLPVEVRSIRWDRTVESMVAGARSIVSEISALVMAERGI